MKAYNLGKLGTPLPHLHNRIHYRCFHWTSDTDFYQMWSGNNDLRLISVGLCELNGEIHVSATQVDSDTVFIFKLKQIVELIESNNNLKEQS